MQIAGQGVSVCWDCNICVVAAIKGWSEVCSLLQSLHISRSLDDREKI